MVAREWLRQIKEEQTTLAKTVPNLPTSLSIPPQHRSIPTLRFSRRVVVPHQQHLRKLRLPQSKHHHRPRCPPRHRLRRPTSQRMRALQSFRIGRWSAFWTFVLRSARVSTLKRTRQIGLRRREHHIMKCWVSQRILPQCPTFSKIKGHKEAECLGLGSSKVHNSEWRRLQVVKRHVATRRCVLKCRSSALKTPEAGRPHSRDQVRGQGRE